MSFSATILFTPPAHSGPGGEEQAPPTPISVGGDGVSVRGTDQLLHLIYQRVQRAVDSAEEALNVARSNQRALQRLERDVRRMAEGGGVRQGASHSSQQSPHDREATPDPNGVSRGREPLENRALRATKCQVHIESPSVCDSYTAACSPVHQLASSPVCKSSSVCTDSRPDSDPQPELYPEGSQGSEEASAPNLRFIEDIFQSGFTGAAPTAPSYTAPSRCQRLKCSRRKRDVVLS
eukprot:g32332.t1